MATTPSAENPLGIDLSRLEATAARVRELNERLIESSRAAGTATLDAYERALKSLVDFEEKVAGASQLEWVSALAQMHAGFVRDVSAAYTKAAASCSAEGLPTVRVPVPVSRPTVRLPINHERSCGLPRKLNPDDSRKPIAIIGRQQRRGRS